MDATAMLQRLLGVPGTGGQRLDRPPVKRGISERPYAWVLDEDELTRRCSNCFRASSAGGGISCINSYASGQQPGHGPSPSAVPPWQLKRCRGCRLLRYCSQDCQKRDWKLVHSVECKALSQSDLEFTAAKVDPYVRIVGRTLLRTRIDSGCPEPDTVFSYSQSSTLDDLPSRQAEFVRHKSCQDEFDEFRINFEQVYPPPGAINATEAEHSAAGMPKPLSSWPWSQVDAMYWRVRSTAFPVLVFDVDSFGCRRIGLGLYLNYGLCAHRCSKPDISTTTFEVSKWGPILRGKISGDSGAIEISQMTVSRLEVPFASFGTNVLLPAERDQFLATTYGIDDCTSCDNSLCSSGQRARRLEQYGANAECPRCKSYENVVSGVCRCMAEDSIAVDPLPFPDADNVSRKQRSPKKRAGKGSCKLCESPIPPCDRLQCLSDGCSLVFPFVNPPEDSTTMLKYDQKGAPVLVQVLNEVFAQSELPFLCEKYIDLTKVANAGTNAFTMRLVEAEMWTTLRDICSGARPYDGSDWNLNKAVLCSESVFASDYQIRLPGSSYALIALRWLVTTFWVLMQRKKLAFGGGTYKPKFTKGKRYDSHSKLLDCLIDRFGSETETAKRLQAQVAELVGEVGGV